jgi:dihydrofolate synthase/folylpolyglutamate synthase
MATGEVPNIKTRAHAEAFLNDRIGQGVKPGLERIGGLLEFMGDPQKDYPSIHIAGTNGKTTASRMVQQILGAHGLATGAFTSPHLHAVEERFTLHGVTVDTHDFIDAVSDIAWFVEAYEQQVETPVTYFEVTAALAFSIFSTAAVDVAVVEVGLGGRLDATNILDGAVAVVTGVDMDHTEFLGSTISKIAAEKVAIVKSGGTLVTGRLLDDAAEAVAERVEATGSNWISTGSDFSVMSADIAVGGWQCAIEGVFGRYEDLYLPIHGRHQVDNLATAIAASEMFLGRELDPDSLSVAVGSISAPGRIEIVDRRPLVIVDGAHNVQGFRGLARSLASEFPAMEWQLVLGVRGERDIAELVEPLNGLIGQVFATAPDDPVAIAPDIVATASAAALGVETFVVPSAADAVQQATAAAGDEGGVIVAGSLYLVGEVRAEYELLRDRSADAHLRFEAERDEGPEYDLGDVETD